MARKKQRNSTTSKTLKAISLYTGAGGLDLGVEAAGFETVAAVEMDPDCCKTMQANRSWPIIERCVHQVPSDEILEISGLKPGEADLLIGGPPCQPFSKSSYWVSGDSLRLDDPRADTLSAYLRVLQDTQPKVFILENVSGLTYKNKDEGLQLLLKATQEINKRCKTNYKITWRILQAAEHGVPQLRERVFLIGDREGRHFDFPEPKYFNPEDLSDPQTSFLSLEPYRTAWDAIGDLPEEPDEASIKIGGKWGDLIPAIPEGHNYLWHTDRYDGMPLFGWRTRYWSFLLKLAKNKPSWTIQAQPGSAIGPFHWKNRKLTIREMCRLQTFPNDFEIIGSRVSAQKQLGNAVPSLLTEILGREIRKQFLFCPIKTKLKLLPPKKIPIPEPEKVMTVPAKYHKYAGKHNPHPGTGKGPKVVANPL